MQSRRITDTELQELHLNLIFFLQELASFRRLEASVPFLRDYQARDSKETLDESLDNLNAEIDKLNIEISRLKNPLTPSPENRITNLEKTIINDLKVKFFRPIRSKIFTALLEKFNKPQEELWKQFQFGVRLAINKKLGVYDEKLKEFEKSYIATYQRELAAQQQQKAAAQKQPSSPLAQQPKEQQKSFAPKPTATPAPPENPEQIIKDMERRQQKMQETALLDKQREKEFEKKNINNDFKMISAEVLMYGKLLSELKALPQMKATYEELAASWETYNSTFRDYMENKTFQASNKVQESLTDIRNKLINALGFQIKELKTHAARTELLKQVSPLTDVVTKERLSKKEVDHFYKEYLSKLQLIISAEHNELADIQQQAAGQPVDQKKLEAAQKDFAQKEKALKNALREAEEKAKKPQDEMLAAKDEEKTKYADLIAEIYEPVKLASEEAEKSRQQLRDLTARNVLKLPDEKKTNLSTLPDAFKILRGSTGIAESRGRRPKQEDAFQLSIEPVNLFFFQSTAELKKGEQEKLSRIALMNTAAAMHATCRKEHKGPGGSTALTVLDKRDGNKVRITTSYLGDSSAYVVLINKTTGKFSCRRLNSHLHNPDPGTPERDRIKKKYGDKVFMFNGCWYIGGDVGYGANTRSYGDWHLDDFGLYRRPEIEIHEIELKDEEAYTVLVCDGVDEPTHHHDTSLLDALDESIADATAFSKKYYDDRPREKRDQMIKQCERDIGTLVAYGIKQGNSLDNIALSLVSTAIKAGSFDNCTAIVGRVEPVASKKDLDDGHGGRAVADILAKKSNDCMAAEINELTDSLSKGFFLIKDFNPILGKIIEYQLPRSSLGSLSIDNDAKTQSLLEQLEKTARAQRRDAKSAKAAVHMKAAPSAAPAAAPQPTAKTPQKTPRARS